MKSVIERTAGAGCWTISAWSGGRKCWMGFEGGQVMNMTREELRQWFAEWLDDYYDKLYSEDDLTPEVAESVLTALRPISREQVEKLFPGCPKCRTCNSCAFRYIEPGEEPCLSCNNDTYSNYKAEPSRIFCSTCGSPLTDEAVGITLKRLEALKDGK